MKSLEIFSVLMEKGYEKGSEEYNEGYDFVIESISYSIRSKEIKSMRKLNEMIEFMDSDSFHYSGDYLKGYEDAIDRSKKYQEICA